MSAEFLHLDESAAHLELLPALESLPEALLDDLQGSVLRLVHYAVYHCKYRLHGAGKEADGGGFREDAARCKHDFHVDFRARNGHQTNRPASLLLFPGHVEHLRRVYRNNVADGIHLGERVLVFSTQNIPSHASHEARQVLANAEHVDEDYHQRNGCLG